MPENNRFTDDVVTVPVRDAADADREKGRTAYILDEPRDESQSAAWLAGYDRARAEDPDAA